MACIIASPASILAIAAANPKFAQTSRMSARAASRLHPACMMLDASGHEHMHVARARALEFAIERTRLEHERLKSEINTRARPTESTSYDSATQTASQQSFRHARKQRYAPSTQANQLSRQCEAAMRSVEQAASATASKAHSRMTSLKVFSSSRCDCCRTVIRRCSA